jgi:ketosteroid isomerase-like protein
VYSIQHDYIGKLTPTMTTSTGPGRTVERLIAATNAHDIDAITACFSADYVNHTPVHPARGFVGAEQVRRNWTQILGGVPDLVATIVAIAEDGDLAWTEIEMRGRRRDGSAHVLRGVIVFTARDELIREARFYLEPLDEASGDVEAAVRAAVQR